MFVQSLKVHFSPRILEWFGSGVMFSWGYYYVTHPQLFTNPTTAQLFSGMLQVAEFFGQPPVTIGLIAMVTGILRAGALFINGAYRRTPLIRLVTAFLSAYIWTSIVVAFGLVSAPNTGLVMYSWMVVADIVSSYRAGYDLVVAESVLRKTRAINGQSGISQRRVGGWLHRIIFSSSH